MLLRKQNKTKSCTFAENLHDYMYPQKFCSGIKYQFNHKRQCNNNHVVMRIHRETGLNFVRLRQAKMSCAGLSVNRRKVGIIKRTSELFCFVCYIFFGTNFFFSQHPGPLEHLNRSARIALSLERSSSQSRWDGHLLHLIPAAA